MKYNPIISSAKHIYKSYSDGDLLFDDFYVISQQNCYYCGIQPKQKHNAFLARKRQASMNAKINGTFIYNGLDRIDSNLPHNKTNVVPCCKFCNYAKNIMTIKEFKQWVIQVYNYWALKE